MTEFNSSQIRFQSFNPYESLCLGHRVVSRETLHLIKRLRDEGYSVVVEPDDGTKLNYLAEKGLREFLSDPIYAVIVGIPLSVLVNIISSWLYDRFKRQPKATEVSLVLEFDEKGNRAFYNHKGEPITETRFQSILESLNSRAQQYEESRKVVPPDHTRPTPIHLEHTGKIIGWGRVLSDDKGLKVESAKITDDETAHRVESGELSGFSISGLIYDSTCSICGKDYVECNHIAGTFYDEVECVVRIDGIDLAEISIVKNPVQPLAKLRKAG